MVLQDPRSVWGSLQHLFPFPAAMALLSRRGVMFLIKRKTVLYFSPSLFVCFSLFSLDRHPK